MRYLKGHAQIISRMRSISSQLILLISVNPTFNPKVHVMFSDSRRYTAGIDRDGERGTDRGEGGRGNPTLTIPTPISATS